jgi:hypothetical protein
VTVVTQAELEKPRSAADLLPWVYSELARFNTKELRRDARDWKHFAGELVDELLPLGLFAHAFYSASPMVTITYVFGDQTHDALVQDGRTPSGKVRYVETTVADRDYEDAKRMELLSRDGGAPGYGQIVAKGPRHKRTELRGDFVEPDHPELVAQHLARADTAVRKKAAKNYPNGTALVVRVDDAVPFRDPVDAAQLQQHAQTELVPLLSNREFRALVFVGSKGLFLPFTL